MSDILIPLSTLLVGAVLGAVLGWVGSTLVWRRQELRDLRSEIVQDITPTIRETAHTSRVAAVRRLSRMEPMLPQAIAASPTASNMMRSSSSVPATTAATSRLRPPRSREASPHSRSTSTAALSSGGVRT